MPSRCCHAPTMVAVASRELVGWAWAKTQRLFFGFDIPGQMYKTWSREEGQLVVGDVGFGWYAKEEANNGLSCPSWPRHASWIQIRKRNNIVVRDKLDGNTTFLLCSFPFAAPKEGAVGVEGVSVCEGGGYRGQYLSGI